MHVPSLHPPDPLLCALSARVNALASASGLVLRYIVLSTLACLLFSSPVAFREVFDANHRPAPRP